MLRVNSSNVLVVPPFECAWLSGDEYLLRDGAGCIAFDVKGDNDVTVILKPFAGSRRWQHMQRAGDGNLYMGLQVDPNYTIILGSHRNRCLKIEKNGNLCCMAEDVPGAKVNVSVFTSYWVDYNAGIISIGNGVPGNNTFYQWHDPEPIPDIRYVGLSSWDKHVGYRSIRVLPAINFGTQTASLQCSEPGIPSLSDLCISYLNSDLCPANVLDALTVAEVLSTAADKLYTASLRYFAADFDSVVREDEVGFLHLSAQTLAAVLNSSELVCNEFELFFAVARWVQGMPESLVSEGRSRLLATDALFPLIRFPLMTDKELEAVRGHKLTACSNVLQELLQEAYQARYVCENTSPNAQLLRLEAPFSVQDRRLVKALSQQEAQAALRFQRRRSPACKELIYISDGDRNGVCHYLGTNFGTQEWVNPVLSKRLVVKASSPTGRYTDPKAVVSGQFIRTSFAGPKYCNGQLQSWWMFDLGEHRLICNYYTVRQDSSHAFPRTWVVQGSFDGESWIDLRRHVNDRTIKLPGQYASWPVMGSAACTPYRMLRLLLDGPNADAASPYNLCLSYIEFYGYFLCNG